MAYRKGELSPAGVDQVLPYQVALPEEPLQPQELGNLCYLQPGSVIQSDKNFEPKP